MKRINNPWLDIEGYNCFGCSPENVKGLKMRFFEDGDDIVAFWRPNDNYTSWLHTVHGGIQSVLLDEICGWVIFRKMKTVGVTAKMETRFIKPVSTQQSHIELRARVKEIKRNIVLVEGEIKAADGTLLCTCVCTYFTFAAEKAGDNFAYREATLDENEVSEEEAIKES